MAARHQFAWGTQVLDASSTQLEHGRAVTELVPAVGDGGAVLDSGPQNRRLRARIQWIPRDGETDADALGRRDAFLASVTEGDARLLVDAVDGEVFAARVADISTSNAPQAALTDDVDFVEDRSTTFAPRDPNVGAEPRAGAEAVQVAADLADAALADVGLESPEPQRAAATAAEWADRASDSDAVVDARRVSAELDARVTGLGDTRSTLGLASTVETGAAEVAVLRVEAALRLAAAAATRTTALSQEITLPRATSLLGLCAQIDPARARALYDGARALQRLDAVLAIPAGTVVRIPRLS